MSEAANPTRRQYARRFGRTTRMDWVSAGYGPFRYAAPAGWLLLASAFRVIAVSHASLPALFCANVMVLLAAIDATRKVVEGMQGRTSLGALSFADLLRLALMAARRLVPFLLAGAIIGVALKLAGLNGFGFIAGAVTSIDGIAFDTDGVIAAAFSALAGLLIFMTIVAHGTGMDTSVAGVLQEIAKRSSHLAPALCAAFCILLAIGVLQDWVRVPVYRTLVALQFRGVVSNLTFYAFVVGFAAVRLTLLIMVFATALRRSYAQTR